MNDNFKRKRIPEEVINKFLDGKDELEKIISIECSYADDVATVIYKDENDVKKIKRDDFYPFIWVKQSGSRKLFLNDKGYQDKALLKKKLAKYNIKVRGLNIYTSDGRTTERLENGFRVLFYADKKMSFSDFLRFFKEGGVDIYDKDKKDFLSISPVEQHMMRTGKRFFKGIDDYDQLLRLQFDLETGGLNPKINRIEQIGINTNKGYQKILKLDGNTKEEKDKNEILMIDDFFKIISEIKPDIITGHNSENFDWNFILVRCEVLGYSAKEISEQYLRRGIYKNKKKTVLKLGGEIEYFYKTNLWGYNLTDSLHAVRRAQAIDSNMKKADLKYVTKYSKLTKPNRVYVKGDDINVLWNDFTNKYALNDTNGNWYKVRDGIIKDGYVEVTGQYIIERYLGDDLYETDKVELRYNQPNFLLGKVLPTTFSRVCTMGTAGIWKLIMLAWSYENDLGIPDFDKEQKFTGGLSRLLRVGYIADVVKTDYNSLYPSVDITWEIEPKLDISGVMLSLLTYILDQREKYKDLKNLCKTKSKEIKKKLSTLDKNSEEYKKLSEEKKYYDTEAESNDKKQLPFKIFANSFFGGFGAPNLFNWGDISCAEKTTCIGRQSLRLMVKWFSDRKFNAIVMDTDGVNFSYSDVDLTYTYVSNGMNRNTKPGEVYTGIEAYVAEFNDLFMRGKMGLGIDEYAPATINFSRKNYADLLKDGEIKYVGNTIKSKKMPTYIENFINKGVELLLYKKGKEFLESYYDYIEKIYNYKIPLRDIASKGKIKKTIEEYKEDCKTITKAGRPKNRQVWYELAIQNNIKPDIGETIYYINTGNGVKKSSYKDVEKVKRKDNPNEFDIVINCIMLNNDIVEAEEDVFCSEDIEYNVPKYIEQFNKRIKPLLVCFSPEIRNDILITSPKDRKVFTETASVLCSGFPNKPEDQDSLEQLMTMEDKEIKFWISVDEIPPFINECGFNWEEIVSNYKKRMEMLKKQEIVDEIELFNTIVDELTEDDVDEFVEEVKLPKKLIQFLELDTNNMNLISKKHNIVIGSAYDIVDKIFLDKDVDETQRPE